MLNRKGLQLTLATVALGAVMVGCADNRATEGTARQGVQDPYYPGTDIPEDPSPVDMVPDRSGTLDYSDIEGRIGQRVVLTGEIDDFFGERVFDVESDAIGRHDLLVIVKGATAMPSLTEDQNVRVSGTLMQYDEVHAQEPWYRLMPEEHRIRFQSETAIIADEVTAVADFDRHEHQILFE